MGTLPGQMWRNLCAQVLHVLTATIGALAGHAALAAPVSLPAYGAALTQTSVSGLSAGAYMAVQMHVIHSSIMQGVGVFAGGPYHCAEGNVIIAQTRCMRPNILFAPPQPADIARYVRITRERGGAGLIDDPANLARQKAWIFVGSADDVVRPAVVDALAAYYGNFMPARHIVYRTGIPTFHNQIVLEGDRRIPPCNHKNNSAARDPYINDCDIDAAGELLQHIYGPLAARNGGAPAGAIIEYDQHEFLANPRSHGLDDTGWAYVPHRCANGMRCRVHVAFHGCFQYAEHVQDAYVRNSGINQWADTNGIIVLYPQTVSVAAINPNGCFDWWGYTERTGGAGNYDTRAGVQIGAFRRMIDRVTGDRAGAVANQRQFASDPDADGYVLAGRGGQVRVGRFASLAVGHTGNGEAVRALLSFDTSAIPAGATITRAFLDVTPTRTYGAPWDAGALLIDVKRGQFGLSAGTETADWADAPTAAAVATLARFERAGARSAEFSPDGLAAIAQGDGAVTQVRLHFPGPPANPGYVRLAQGAGATLTVHYH